MAKTSVYLNKDRQARMEALGVGLTLLDVVEAGLAALERERGPVRRIVPSTVASARLDGMLKAAGPASFTNPRGDAEPRFAVSHYLCCMHCSHPPTVNGHKERCLQCPA